MYFIAVQLTLLAVALRIQSINGLDGFGFEVLMGRMDCLENMIKESQETVFREIQESRTETKTFGEALLRKLEEFERKWQTNVEASNTAEKLKYETLVSRIGTVQSTAMETQKNVLQDLQELKGITQNEINQQGKEVLHELHEFERNHNKNIVQRENVLTELQMELKATHNETKRLGRDFIINFQELKVMQNETKKQGENILTELQPLKRLKESQTEIKKLEQTVLSEVQKMKGLFFQINSCRETIDERSGIYGLKVANQTFNVYCEQNQYGGGWIVIQNRFDGSVDFSRNWTEYRNGFGRLDEEFWLGLEKIHLLTSTKSYELMVHLEDFEGVEKHANYEKFEIGSEQNQYELSAIHYSFYNGTAGDSLFPHRLTKFSTRDRDNDADSAEHFSEKYQAGWWMDLKYNFETNLNGKYSNSKGENMMHWYKFNDSYQGLKVSKMMIREV